MRGWRFKAFIALQLLLGAIYLTLALVVVLLAMFGALLTGSKWPPVGVAMLIGGGYVACRWMDRKSRGRIR